MDENMVTFATLHQHFWDLNTWWSQSLSHPALQISCKYLLKERKIISVGTMEDCGSLVLHLSLQLFHTTVDLSVLSLLLSDVHITHDVNWMHVNWLSPQTMSAACYTSQTAILSDRCRASGIMGSPIRAVSEAPLQLLSSALKWDCRRDTQGLSAGDLRILSNRNYDVDNVSCSLSDNWSCCEGQMLRCVQGSVPLSLQGLC